MADPGSASHAAATHLAHATEVRWGYAMAAVIAIIFAVIVATGVSLGLQPPSRVEPIDTPGLANVPEFAEGNLGTRALADGSVVVRFVAQQYAFVPNCLLVPADTPVTLRIASGDVVHGLLITGTNVNTMIVPGYVSTVRTSFTSTGERLMPCHEYCGVGHQAMWAHVRIVERNAFPFAQAKSGPVSCAR